MGEKLHALAMFGAVAMGSLLNLYKLDSDSAPKSLADHRAPSVHLVSQGGVVPNGKAEVTEGKEFSGPGYSDPTAALESRVSALEQDVEFVKSNCRCLPPENAGPRKAEKEATIRSGMTSAEVTKILTDLGYKAQETRSSGGGSNGTFSGGGSTGSVSGAGSSGSAAYNPSWQQTAPYGGYSYSTPAPLPPAAAPTYQPVNGAVQYQRVGLLRWQAVPSSSGTCRVVNGKRLCN